MIDIKVMLNSAAASLRNRSSILISIKIKINLSLLVSLNWYYKKVLKPVPIEEFPFKSLL